MPVTIAIKSVRFNIIEAFTPQLILISADFDGHAEDGMSEFLLKEIADKHYGGRIVSTLEGGYNLNALGRSVVAHLKGLL